jgi:hypothetical protein
MSINTAQFEQPLSFCECSSLGTNRVQFNRRKSHANKQIVIIQFEGVIGNIDFTKESINEVVEEVTL